MHDSETAKHATASPLALVLVGAVALYVAFIVRSAFRAEGRLFFTLIDDAMISMRYAQHLAAGSGLVWNIGEPPVEGFTNLGWTLLMAILHFLPLPPGWISLAVMSCAGAILLLNVLAVHRICNAIQPTARYAPIMAAAITAFYFPLVFWSLRGMEVGLLVLLINLAILQFLKERRGTGAAIAGGLILAAAILVRMDAALQAIVLLVYAIGAGRWSRGRTLIPALIVVIAVAAIVAFQQLYFADAVPNTYYQKVVGSTITERVRNGVLVFNNYASRDVWPMVLVSALGLWLYRRSRTWESGLLAGLFAVQCLYSVWVGGDYAEPEVAAANRFITQGMPALIMLFSLAADNMLSDILPMRSQVDGLRSPATPLVSAAVALLTLIAVSGTPWINWAVDNAPLLKADIRRVRAGLAIAEHTSPAATIAVHAAGQIPYYSGRRTIDLLGLNDPIIAKAPRSGPFYPGHDKWNYDYSIGQLQPDLIADNWIRLGDFIRGRHDYRQLENGMYVRIGTAQVDEAGLVSAYP